MILDETQRKAVFQFFNEVGIIQQLASTMFNKCLPDGLHVSHFAVLNHLVRLGDEKTPLALAEAFQVTKGTMTHTLATLSKRGFITLRPHATDGRSKIVLLTDEGRAFQVRAMESLSPAMAALDGKLDYDKMIDMLPELSKVRAILDANRDL
ncbi:MAG: MarR family winged helix-turn-helix transcriptional regulator [Pseudomonadota bacterium]